MFIISHYILYNPTDIYPKGCGPHGVKPTDIWVGLEMGHTPNIGTWIWNMVIIIQPMDD